MTSRYKTLMFWIKLLSDKLDYLIQNIEYEDEMPEDVVDAPTDNPPNFIPDKALNENQGKSLGDVGVYAIDPGAIKPCVNRFVYIWLRKGRSFWAYLTYVGRRSTSGYRWNGKRWIYFGIDLRKIDSFVCY